MTGDGSGQVRSTGSFAAKTATVAVMSIVGVGVKAKVGVDVLVGEGVWVGLAVGDGRTVSVALGAIVACCDMVGVIVGVTALVASATAGSPVAVASGVLPAVDWQPARANITVASVSSTK